MGMSVGVSVSVDLLTGKSAEVIVVNGNEPQIETAEASQISEGPNIKLFQML